MLPNNLDTSGIEFRMCEYAPVIENGKKQEIDMNNNAIQPTTTFSGLSMQRKSDEWICSMCLIPNPSSLSVCEACETPKDSSESFTTNSVRPGLPAKTTPLTFEPGFFGKSISGSEALGQAFNMRLPKQSITEFSTTPPPSSSSSLDNEYKHFKTCATEKNLNLFSVGSTTPSQISTTNIFARLKSEPPRTADPTPHSTSAPLIQLVSSSPTSSFTLDSSRTVLGLLKRSRDLVNPDNSYSGTSLLMKRQRISPSASPLASSIQEFSPSFKPLSPSREKSRVDGFFANMIESPQYRREYRRKSSDDEIIPTPLRVETFRKPMSPLRDINALSSEALDLLLTDGNEKPEIPISKEVPALSQDISQLSKKENSDDAQQEYRFSFGAWIGDRSSIEGQPRINGQSNGIDLSTPSNQTPSFATPNFGSVEPVNIIDIQLNSRGSLEPRIQIESATTSTFSEIDSSSNQSGRDAALDIVSEYRIEPEKYSGYTGIVFTWGSGECDQLALSDLHLNESLAAPLPRCIVKLRKQKVIQVTCGALHSLALLSDGSVVAWGCNDDFALGRTNEKISERQPARIENLPRDDPVTMISCGDCHTACITKSGNCYIWGSYKDSCGYIGFPNYEDPLWMSSIATKKTFIPTRVRNLCGRCIRVSSGENHTCVLCLPENDATEPLVYLWGSAEFGQLALDAQNEKGKPKESYLFPQLLDTSKFEPSGICTNIFCGIATTFFEMRYSNQQFYYGVGRNCCGELGIESREEIVSTPQRLLINRNIRDMSSCQFATLALTEDGKVFTWGKVDLLGRSSTSVGFDPTPEQVTSLEGSIRSVGRGGDTMFVVNEKGVLYSWGEGQMFQIGDGNEYENAVLVPRVIRPTLFDGKSVLHACGGSQHSVALVYNGECLSPKELNWNEWTVAFYNGRLGTTVNEWFTERLLKSSHQTEKRSKRKGGLIVAHEPMGKIAVSSLNKTQERIEKELLSSSALPAKRVTRTSQKLKNLESQIPVKNHPVPRKNPPAKKTEILRSKKVTKSVLPDTNERSKELKNTSRGRAKTPPKSNNSEGKTTRKLKKAQTSSNKKKVEKSPISKHPGLTPQKRGVLSESPIKTPLTHLKKTTNPIPLTARQQQLQQSKASSKITALEEVTPTRKMPMRKARQDMSTRFK